MQIQNHSTAQALPAQYFNPATRHSDGYYLALLLALAEGVEGGATDRQLADMLSQRGILSPVGKPWTATAVGQALSKFRRYREGARACPNRLHQAFLQLCFDGYLRPSDVSVLFRQRRPRSM